MLSSLHTLAQLREVKSSQNRSTLSLKLDQLIVNENHLRVKREFSKRQRPLLYPQPEMNPSPTKL